MERSVIYSSHAVRQNARILATALVGSALLSMCTLTSAAQSNDPLPAEAVDQLTLLYINHRIYPDLTVDCRPKTFGDRVMVGCRGYGLGRKSSVHVWNYADGKFWSINGNASSLAGTKFSGEKLVAVTPLPLPSDIDVGKIVEEFSSM